MTAAADTLITRLAAALDPGLLITAPEQLDALARDQLRKRRSVLATAGEPAAPLAAVRPRSTTDVAVAVRVAGELGVPVVEYGGGTGLMGGARTVTPGLVLDLRGMNRVLDCSARDRTVTVQAGAVLADVNAALAPRGLMLGHDPWTVPIATVGGTISTDSLGYRGGQYGSMGDQVLGLEVVLAGGAVLRTRAVPRQAAGPRLNRLFVGAEGVFGVITEATVRVFPLPEQQALAAFDLPSFAAGFETACALLGVGIAPAVLDFGAPPDGEGRLYLGFEGAAEVVTAQMERARRITLDHGAAPLPERVAVAWWADRHIEPEQLRGWRQAEAAEPAPGTPGSSMFEYLHLALPAGRVPAFIEQAGALAAARGVSVREWGLWHGPELLSTVLACRTDTPAALAAVAEAVNAVLILAQDMGGSMEYVHGAGLRYAHLMAREQGPGLDLLQAIKRALDPHNLLNPGKLGLAG